MTSFTIGPASSFQATIAASAAPNATIHPTNAATNSVVALPANAARQGVIAVNNSDYTMYIAFASSASASSFTYKLAKDETLEATSGVIYTGDVSVVWAGATGNAMITELTGA